MQDRFKFRAYNFLSKKYTYFDEPEVQFAERNSVYQCEVIGNVYENPELIGGEE